RPTASWCPSSTASRAVSRWETFGTRRSASSLRAGSPSAIRPSGASAAAPSRRRRRAVARPSPTGAPRSATRPRQRRAPERAVRSASATPLEELDRALVLLGRLAGGEGPQVLALAGLRVRLPRVEAVFARLELADHDAAVSGR